MKKLLIAALSLGLLASALAGEKSPVERLKAENAEVEAAAATELVAGGEKHMKEIEAAFKMMTLWIRMTDAPYGKLGGFLPILKDVEPAFEDPEIRKIMLEEIAPTAVPVPRLENLPELNDLLSSALGKVLLGDASPKEALDDAAKRYNTMYAE